MKLELLDPPELEDLIKDKQGFIDSLKKTGYIVRGMYDEKFIDDVKAYCLAFSESSEPSWHPCLDGCPDYHRLHNNYPGAYVKSVQHAYYFHPWNDNLRLIEKFRSIYELKYSLVNDKLDSRHYLRNIPSEGPIARLVIHQYPPGGGGQEEHVDPVSDFALVQTIIQASSPGVDYLQGGLYVNDEEFGKINIDAITRKGDLILLSPGIRHGVDAIDGDVSLDWENTSGRWIIMPIILHSDVSQEGVEKPIGLGSHG